MLVLYFGEMKTYLGPMEIQVLTMGGSQNQEQ